MPIQLSIAQRPFSFSLVCELSSPKNLPHCSCLYFPASIFISLSSSFLTNFDSLILFIHQRKASNRQDIAMTGDKAMFDSSETTVLPQSDSLSPTCDALWLPTSTSSAPTLYGAKSAGDFENVGGEETFVKEENRDYEELLDVCLNQSTKKRRLTANQVQYLEKNFEVENKLEPERKLQLSTELGLQPRQVAIWFQNRRARFKNKQLEKDYDSLKISYEKLKAGYESLVREKESLENEVVSLQKKLLNREKGTAHLEQVDATVNPSLESIPKPMCEKVCKVPMVITPKQEDASSAKSDVFDSDSPTVSLLEPGDSSQALGPDQSEFSQDEEDNPSRTYLLLSSYFPDAPSANSCNFEFPAVEEQPFWTWTY